MPVYGSFKVTGMGPFRTWEADTMRRDGDVVDFFRYGTADNPSGDHVGSASLEKGWTITEVDSTKAVPR